MIPRLRFSEKQIEEIASRYWYPILETTLVNLRPEVVARGYLLKEELKELAYWKAPKSSRHIDKNSEEYLEEITGIALQARTERARIEVLTNLHGISWPTASVILHFFHRDPYPIMDFRALWSVSLDVPSQYIFEFWWPYVDFCRRVAERNGVNMRTLDKALWQYSKKNQGLA
jgi:hypothetical protein